jgi:O-antigen/teichoic acid export membrane protein
VSARDEASKRRDFLAFFRQSGWLLVATGLTGFFLIAVHTPAGQMAGRSKAEYSLFTTLLDALPLLGIPAAGLQAVFAQMMAGAVDETRRAMVRAAVRRVLVVVTLLWTVAALAVWVERDAVIAGWRIQNPTALWLTLAVALISLWTPVFLGLLQGAQRFLWIGNASIAMGLGRFVGVALFVVLLGGLAAGAMAGVLVGACLALAIAVWSSRSEWRGPVDAAGAWSWLRPWLALTLGLAAGSVMLSADTQLVQWVFTDDKTAFYMAAGRVGRGVVALTMPLALVLFPKVARSAATGESTGALKLALGATLGTGVSAALVCTLVPWLPIRALYAGNATFLPAAELVPLFCWCMLPLTAAYTLINNLLARGRFAAVPWLLAVAVGYLFTLWWIKDGLASRELFAAFRSVLQVLGIFSLLLLGVASVFSLRRVEGAREARRV